MADDEPGTRSGARGAIAALACVSLAWGVRWLLHPVLGNQVPFLLFFPAIVFVSWFWGRNAGLLAVALSALFALRFLPGFELSAAGVTTGLMLGLFILVGSSIAVAVALMHRARIDVQEAFERSEQAAAQLRASEQSVRLLASIVESSEDAIIAQDLVGRIIGWNRSAERLFGYSEKEALGQSIEMLMPPDRADDWRHILNRVANGERVERFETKRRARDGRILNVSLTVSPVRDAEGRIVGAAKIVRDVTAEREAQIETEKTRELFIGTLSHDLRNPLNAITVTLHTLNRQAPETAQKAIARMANSADRMSRMIDQLMDLTKSRLGGGIPIDPQSADLALVCQSVTDEFEALQPGRTRLSMEGNLTGRWDSDRLAQVLANLLSNAFKYGAAGVPVSVSAKSCGPSVVVEVTNQGPEIPASLIPVIFDPFRRGPLEANRGVMGLGLGLYIVREIVQAHQGEITARSSPTEGTTFSVRLPRMSESVLASSGSRPVPRTTSPKSTTGGR
ncbi:MAG: PAS domain S-box protein [Acidobacteriota bacterium]